MLTLDRKLSLLKECYEIASKSPDPSNQNGAITINEFGSIVSRGINTFPDRVQLPDNVLTDRNKKLFYVEHSERNAIFAAARKRSTEGLVMICPWFACSDCSKAIMLSGIRRVIGHKERMDMTPDRWKESVDAGLKMLRDYGVALEFISAKLDCTPIIVNGELWVP